MTVPEDPRLTDLLNQLDSEDPDAADRAMELVYPELVRIARVLSSRERSWSLDPIGLVSEAYLKLVRRSAPTVRNRRHFFNLAASAMREVLTDDARRRSAKKRGGPGQQTVELQEDVVLGSFRSDDVLDVDMAIAKLLRTDPEAAEVALLRFFVGTSEKETAELLGTTEYQVERRFKRVRTWFVHELED
ncbi:MAG: sigma-70 family RNA polymerase sigma factor [Candidatus Eisenbacteria bacterium]|uniref:Sigma-70 family RNA polymerase sigma factor n=1 Tax=Eiseniibacteriota bacterium TaxID=2212470 RepID=A0A956SDY6_UNCEI|nr:sigma-70 family RNA polymerase sigma factor [Candidatus Eisenbacteria bacterium]MCB9466516.1 sigma-70 family RNA polymerase sigma factor [Candidatus Eisenbacteria bacterium]